MKATRNNFFRTSDDAVLYYEDHGQGKPIVILHGYMCSSQFFLRNVEALSKDHRLILMDFRGSGSSSKILQGHSIRRYAMDVKELLDYLQLEDALLLGWSMGASVALQYHLLYGKEHLRAIGIVDPTLAPYHEGEWNRHGLRDYNVDGANNLVIASYAGFDSYCQGFSEKMLRFKGDEEEIAFFKKELLKTPPWIAFSIYTEFAHTDGREMLGHITLPILLFGANSEVNPLGEDCAKVYYNEMIPKDIYREIYTHEIGGHLLFYKDAEAFNREVLSFYEHVLSM